MPNYLCILPLHLENLTLITPVGSLVYIVLPGRTYLDYSPVSLTWASCYLCVLRSHLEKLTMIPLVGSLVCIVTWDSLPLSRVAPPVTCVSHYLSIYHYTGSSSSWPYLYIVLPVPPVTCIITCASSCYTWSSPWLVTCWYSYPSILLPESRVTCASFPCITLWSRYPENHLRETESQAFLPLLDHLVFLCITPGKKRKEMQKIRKKKKIARCKRCLTKEENTQNTRGQNAKQIQKRKMQKIRMKKMQRCERHQRKEKQNMPENKIQNMRKGEVRKTLMEKI